MNSKPGITMISQSEFRRRLHKGKKAMMYQAYRLDITTGDIYESREDMSEREFKTNREVISNSPYRMVLKTDIIDKLTDAVRISYLHYGRARDSLYLRGQVGLSDGLHPYVCNLSEHSALYYILEKELR